MRQPLSAATALILFIAISVAGCTTGSQNSGHTVTNATIVSPSAQNYTIEITGGIRSPVTVTYNDLEAMNRTTMKNATMIKTGSGAMVTSDWTGVSTMDILAKAGLPAGTSTIKMYSPDGYVMTYTTDQLKGTMLGLEKNGTTLNADVNDNNPIQLVAPDQTGHEWIKVPTKIVIAKP